MECFSSLVMFRTCVKTPNVMLYTMVTWIYFSKYVFRLLFFLIFGVT